MYLLKPFLPHFLFEKGTHSHSTMYLLKLHRCIRSFPDSAHSHSTMYLLKLIAPQPMYFATFAFTFHHVSIKTVKEIREKAGITHSHSTMYLLKPKHIHGVALEAFIHIPPCIY